MKFSTPYHIVKQGVKLCRLGFYRKQSVVGIENLPKGKPFILAPNHQSGFMDPIMVAVSIRWLQTFYLVRADIFKKKLASKILHSLNMLPIYRMRDGVDSIEKNEQVFQNCYRILEEGNPLMIFAEGNHSNVKKLRPLKKGIARIAFGAEEKNDFNLDLQIVPVGINYSNHTRAGATLQVAFGKAIAISDYKENYLKEPSRTLHDVREKVYKGISDLIINIKSEHYELVEDLRKIYEYELSEGTFELDTEIENSQNFITAFESANDLDIDRMKQLVNDVKNGASSLKLKLFVLSKESHSNLLLNVLGLVLSFPIFLFGLLNNFLPFQIPSIIVEKKIKDEHFHSSLKIGIALVLFPIFYLIQTAIVYLLSESILVSLVYLIAIFISLFISLKWFYKWREITQKLKVNKLFKTKNYQDLIVKRIELKKQVSSFYTFSNDA